MENHEYETKSLNYETNTVIFKSVRKKTSLEVVFLPQLVFFTDRI